MKDSLQYIREGGIIDFKKADCVAWDELMFIAPAFGRKSVENHSGVSLPVEINYSWEYDGEGHVWWILFLKDKKPVAWFSVLRATIDFSKFVTTLPGNNPYDFAILDRKKAKVLAYYTGELNNIEQKIIDAKLIP